MIDGAVAYKRRTYRLWESRSLQGKVLCGSFSQDARGRWYVNFVCEVECTRGEATKEVGIDLGLKTFATLSTGEAIENPRHFRKYEVALAKAQRAGRKQRARAIHAKIANARADFLHKQSTRIAGQFGRIVVGNINSGKLAKTRMAKSVRDVGWSSFRNMLAYKTRLRGGEYIEGDERYSTQVCSECGSIAGPKGISQLGVRNWECGGCGAVHDRDVNAARNILRFAAEHRRPVAEIPLVRLGRC
jgi:putative transposase